MTTDEDILKTLQVISELTYMQIRPQIEKLKKELVTTNLQKKIYAVLDGEKTAKDIAKAVGCAEVTIWRTLPEWEKQGLVLSFGKGREKKYLNIENLEI